MSIHVAGRGGAGRGGAAVGDFPVLENVYPTSPPLIFGIGSLNTKWGILYQHQYAPAESGSRLAGPSLHIVEQLYT